MNGRLAGVTRAVDRVLGSPMAMRILTVVMAVLATATVMNFVLVAKALNRYRNQATAGDAANVRTCLLYPVSKKLYEGAARYGVISQADLIIYRAVGPPQHCPDPLPPLTKLPQAP